MEEKIRTLHPQGKRGVHISKARYDLVRAQIEAVLTEQPGLTFSGLASEVEHRLAGQFTGSVPWYTVSVKLDLEARGRIERIPGTRPEQLRLVEAENAR